MEKIRGFKVWSGVGFCLLLCCGATWSFSASANGDKLEYPELTVVPRASERIRMEAEREDSQGQWIHYLPIQISAVATLAAGIASVDSTYPGYGVVGISVGAAWLGLTTYLALTHRPYTDGWKRVGPMARNTMRDQLARERIAEEEIRHASAAGERLRWLSILTNLGTSIVMITKPNNGPGFTPTTGVQIGAAVLSLAPLIYRFYWRDVYEEQKEYKKKIYGPIAQPTLLFEEASKSYVPGFQVSLQF